MSWETEQDDENTSKVVSITTGKKHKEKEAATVAYFRSSRTAKWDTKRLDVPVNFRVPESMSRYINDFVEHRSDKSLNSRSDVFRDALELWIWASRRVDEDAITQNARKAAIDLEAEQTLVNYQNVERTIDTLKSIISMGPANYDKARELIERSLEVEDHPVLIKRFQKLLRDMEE